MSQLSRLGLARVLIVAVLMALMALAADVAAVWASVNSGNIYLAEATNKGALESALPLGSSAGSTATRTPVKATPTATHTKTSGRTPSTTRTSTRAATRTRTPVRTPTRTAGRPTPTATRTARQTYTRSVTRTPTRSATRTRIPSPTPTATAKIYVTNGCSDAVTVYPIESKGNAAPLSAGSGLSGPVGIARDASGKIYVTNACDATVAVYAAGSSGNAAPVAVIGGSRTQLNGPEGIALDSSGNIYVANAGVCGFNCLGSVTVYAGLSDGNVAPIAAIAGSNTGLGLPSDVAVDSSGNIYVTNPGGGIGPASVTVYKRGSKGNVSPFATISGSNTGLSSPNGIALDSDRNIYVVNQTSVTVYAHGSYGNLSPKASFSQPGSAIALDLSRNIYVADYDRVQVYMAGSSGSNVKPRATITGPNTRLLGADGIAVDTSGKFYVANRGDASANPGVVTVYAHGTTGNAAPIATIGGSGTGPAASRGIAVDSTGKIYVLAGGVMIYAPGSNAAGAPIATISGYHTGFRSPEGIAVDSHGNIYVTDPQGFPQGSISVFPAGSRGNVAPSAIISGYNTGLEKPEGVALDSKGNIYVANYQGGHIGNGSVTVYPAGSHGNLAPSAIISGGNTLVNFPLGIALDSSRNIYVVNAGSVTVYPPGSTGNVAPSANISGFGLANTLGIALDSTGRIFVSASFGDAVAIYAPGSNGAVTPIATIGGSRTELHGPVGIAIGP